MKVLVTGANGFIGKNLVVRLKETGKYDVLQFLREHDRGVLKNLVECVDIIVHLAGENRPDDEQAYASVNIGLTGQICQEVESQDRNIPVIFASSIQATLDNPYGRSKLGAEHVLEVFALNNRIPVAVFRLPGVFGKWSRPYYNSVVSTFCHNVAHGLPLQISDSQRQLRLVYIDDVVNAIIKQLDASWNGLEYPTVSPEYCITVGDLANEIIAFDKSRSSLVSQRVGGGLTRALYSTFISYLPISKFNYSLPVYSDPRGNFVEVIKTHDSGQVSFFTVNVGFTRGGHYHHTKTEKFIVLSGLARFRFRQVLTNECFTIETSGEKPEIVETIPGWAHDITNIGEKEMTVMLWVNEIFDPERSDTVATNLLR